MSTLIKDTTDATEQMEHLMHAIYQTLTYTPNSTDNSTSVSQAFFQKKKVFARTTHISCLQYADTFIFPQDMLPECFLEKAQRTHGQKFFFNGSWHAYDPTNNRIADETYIILSKGRDYSDCIIDKGIFQVRHFTTQNMKVNVIVTDAEN